MKNRWFCLIALGFLAAVLVLLPAGCKGKAKEAMETSAPAAPPAETPSMAASQAPQANPGNSMENPYTKDNPGPWAGKEGAHVPQITYEKSGSGLKVTVKIDNHPMDAQTPHYIMAIMLHDGGGNMLGNKDFVATDPAPIATFELTTVPQKLMAYEHCNLHGIWMSQTDVMAQ